MTDSRTLSSRLPVAPILLAAVLIVAEFLIIGLLFKHGINFDCRENWGDRACGTASKSLAALYCVIATVGLFAVLRPALFRALLAEAGHDPRPLGLNLAGFVLAMSPALFMREGDGAAMLWPAFLLWTAGMGLILTGILLWLAPRALWRQFLRQAGLPLLVAMAAGALAPALAVKLQPIWQLETIAAQTFHAVTWLIGALGYEIYSNPVHRNIGVEGFVVSVAPACSGVEGIALVTIFVTLYLWLFRAELRFPRAFLLYPLGIAASVALNIVRIAVLLIIGIEGHPELAVGGFHSHAGWVMFTLVALGIIAVARRVPALHRAPTVSTAPVAPLPPLRRDPVAARILPFAVFMLTAVIAPAISQNPAMFYPIRVILLAAILALVWPALRGIVWRVSPVAWAAGAAIGLMWIAIPVAPSEGPPPYGALTGGLVILWFVFRGIGTVILVPLVEELFFRDYLESRLRGAPVDAPAPLWRNVLAIAISAGLFAALHDRWIEAFIAGVVFSLAVRHRGRIADGIAAHAMANLIVFAFAAATGNLAII
ncbi:exosortase E/protease, VPEID-CTERM system [Paracoccus caeni]|uniref:Exosortase E/protease, VPEID-CTERM system n=1 Tax=Paracoccus caeni TaxID=657651 RepID=A0A934SFT8_9RHOB|nr:exosortase E/protease, VPEID-CTERM system [Paracoccus caeni]MBK4218136.1 exosortase E/protease, VPEID-CTERM system [Paracoccus caeni]